MYVCSNVLLTVQHGAFDNTRVAPNERNLLLSKRTQKAVPVSSVQLVSGWFILLSLYYCIFIHSY